VLLGVPAPDASEQGGGEGEPEIWQGRLERLTGIDPTRCPVCNLDVGRLALAAELKSSRVKGHL